MRTFRNNSQFQGWKHYFDESGKEWRREDRDVVFAFYQAKDDGFAFQGIISKLNRDLSIKAEHERFINNYEEAM